uniref:Uncharacterized protein n=1 Tax=Knipowitschia caucasica TaxID=637954 RepID=A0AAV2LRT0_KNICA
MDGRRRSHHAQCLQPTHAIAAVLGVSRGARGTGRVPLFPAALWCSLDHFMSCSFDGPVHDASSTRLIPSL